MKQTKYALSSIERHHKTRGNQDYDISFFTEKMKISRQQVLEAMNEVGTNREKLENYFKSNTSPVFYY